ncbi:MAG: hypothetical protein A49_19110 [Methyloceanibacter sp.]|nr:MAG: hypothetical protein A49_19110 [Methyloceanibacter sp.]
MPVAAVAADADKVPPQTSPAEKSDKKAVEFTLDNGLDVVVIPDHRAPVVTQMVWYKAGAADEPPGKSGIAHFLEHLMFKGTDNIPAASFRSSSRSRVGTTTPSPIRTSRLISSAWPRIVSLR